MKSWKKQFKKEIAMQTPALREDVKNALIPMEIQQEAKRPNKKHIFKLSWALPTAILAMLILFLSLWFSLKPASPSTPSTHMYSLDINPSVVFITDEEGKVNSVLSLNEDADVVLSYLDTLIDQPIPKAMTAFVDTSAKLGYFDLSNSGDAVLVQGLEDDSASQLEKISEAIQDYFCTKGIYGVFIGEEISLSSFCQNMGIPQSDQIADFIKQIQGQESMFGSRGINEENLSTIYEDYILGSQMLKYVKDCLNRNMEIIYENASFLLKIFSLNTEIMIHEDNPSLFLKDYWSVVRFSDKEYTDPFAKLMNQMVELLDQYEKQFGIHLDTLQNVSDLLDNYHTLSLENIKELENLSVSDFLRDPKRYITILKNIGLDMSSIEDILNQPNTVEEYSIQLDKILSILSMQKETEFKEIYEKNRVSLDESTYKDFIESIEKEYGSLKNYWNFFKEN